MADDDSLQRAEALWFSPDVVIIRADSRIFRVFSAILKAQSSVFADMFAFPQPPLADSMETMDGFPVVELHDDPDDVEVFLKALFDSSFFMPFPAIALLEDIIGILRLSHKYNVPYLRCRALEHLGATLPTRLSDYDIREGYENGKTSLRLMKIIKAATEVDALWLLPVAYHDLCKQEISEILTEPYWKDLGEEERNACLIGHSAQSRYFPKMLSFLWVSKDSDAECDDYTECNRLRLELAANFEHYWSWMTYILAAWGDDEWQEMEDIGICETCIEEAKALYAVARTEFWEQLPQMFGLPEWKELEEMRRVSFDISTPAPPLPFLSE
ncbi:hypothetical protein C8R44DRAFT_53503 [Mycena epipterygia]|nr:hypothetical protein C8R44DRAFT_53503 [Mycena epipterygia]